VILLAAALVVSRVGLSYFYVTTTIGLMIILATIIWMPREKSTAYTSALVGLLLAYSLALRANVYFYYPSIVGIDPWLHARLIDDIVQSGTISQSDQLQWGVCFTLPIHAITTYSKGRRGKNKAANYLFASSSSYPPLNRMLEEYRLRFGIESSYRLLSRSRVRTSTRDPKLRVVYVATSLLLVNTWVEKKWERLSTTRRGPGGRDVDEELLP